MSRPLLPPDVLEALQQGRKIEAIKRLREATGLGLKEAKDMVEAHQAGDGRAFAAPLADPTLPAAVAQALRRGDQLEAIQLLRQHTRIGLKEAKERIDALARPGGGALAPGEVPRTTSRIGTWLTVALLAGLALWWFFVRDPG